jgi:hypothetical protein
MPPDMIPIALTIVVFGVVFTAVAATAHYAASRITPWREQ